MRKILLLQLTIITIFISLLGFTYSYEIIESNVIQFSFNGPTTVYVEVNSVYIDPGLKCEYRGNDITKHIIINSDELDLSKLGEYKIKYSIYINDKEEYVYRKVKVIFFE